MTTDDTAGTLPADPETPSTTPTKRPGALDVVETALDRWALARSHDGLAIAYPLDPREARVATEIKALRPHLTNALAREGVTVSRDAMTQAIDVLVARAQDAPEERVYIRSARVGAALHLDLAQRDSAASFVEISAYGWEIRKAREEDDATAARPLFRRTSATAALPWPEPGGSRDEFRALLGVDDRTFRLVWGWLVGSLFDDVPRPLLWVLGPQGSGKSTRARMIVSVVEPCESLGRPPGGSERDDSVSARGRFLPTFDNVGNVSAATSDWLCRLVTGVTIDRRALYSDDDVRSTVLRRAGVATSIVLPRGLGPDALERLVLVDLERVPAEERRAESAIWAEFDRLHPRILGALLDDVAGVLANLSRVREEARTLPRMADYALILAALDEHLGEPEDDGYAAVYADTVTGVLADRAKDDPLVAALVRHVSAHGGTWEGRAEALLAALEHYRPDDYRAPWPHDPRGLSTALRVASETLTAAGIDARPRKSNGAKLWTVTLRPSDVDDDEPAETRAA